MPGHLAGVASGGQPTRYSSLRGHYAHTLPGRPEDEWQDLLEHLKGVAARAGSTGGAFDAGEWARLAGLWHDLGKYSEAFQTYLRTSNPDPHVAEVARGTVRVDHSTAGAQHAAKTIDVLGHLLAYPIAGHHSGLLDALGPGACLEARLNKTVDAWSAPASILEAPTLKLPNFVAAALSARDAFCVAFFVRMLFSCLVDADFLDTEHFMSPACAARRPAWPADVLKRMADVLDADSIVAHPGPDSVAEGAERAGLVNEQRAQVRRACLAAAEREPGLFSLTVPTGGGKTLSSLSFALRHAIRYGLGRVIYVAPFTTIIDQNADVFRRVMSPLVAEGLLDPVVEHHSNLDAGLEPIFPR